MSFAHGAVDMTILLSYLAVLFLHLPDRLCQLATFLLQFCLMLIAAATTIVN